MKYFPFNTNIQRVLMLIIFVSYFQLDYNWLKSYIYVYSCVIKKNFIKYCAYWNLFMNCFSMIAFSQVHLDFCHEYQRIIRLYKQLYICTVIVTWISIDQVMLNFDNSRWNSKVSGILRFTSFFYLPQCL